MKLNRKVRFSDKVQPIKLPKGGLSYQGYQAYVSGWGIQGPYEGPSSRLKGAELVVSTVNFRFKHVQFKEVFRFKEEFHLTRALMAESISGLFFIVLIIHF